MSKITLNIVEPSSSTPVVPDTGLFTHGVGGTETTIIISAVILLAIVAIILAVCIRKKVQILEIIKSRKRISAGLAAISLLVSACTFTAFMLNTNKSNTSAKEGEEGLTVNAESKELTIEVKDQPVFAVLPVQVTVEEATAAGYTLTAYTDNTDLVSTTNPNNKIPMVTVEGDELTSLEDNTWGLALDNEPEAKDNKVYKALSTDQDNPTIIKTIDDYSETEANDTTTIYYGFYITPDIPYGTYTGGEVEYEAEENKVATVTFDGNGLYFNNEPSQTTNTVKYIPGITSNTAKYSHTPNINDGGEASGIVGYHGGDILNKVITIPGASRINIKLSYGGGYISGGYPAGFVSFWQGSHPDYTTSNNADSTRKTCGNSDVADGKFYGDRNNENTIITTECELEGDSATFAYWTSGGGPSQGAIYGYYAVVTGYDANGNIIYLSGNSQVGGEYKDPAQGLPYIFLGWSEDKDATTATYKSKNEIEQELSLAKGKTVELYAVWQHATKIIFDGNGSTSGEMLDKLLSAGNGMNLCSYYSRTGQYFVNWNTEPDGSGVTYDYCYYYTAPSDQSIELTLYAQWSDCGYNMICYKPNGANAGDDDPKMSGQSTNSYSDVALHASNYRYDTDDDGHNDMGFIGWSEDPDAARKLMDNDGSNNSTIYGPNQTITTGDIREGIRLYAAWLAPAKDKDGNTLTFQTEDLLNIRLSDSEGDTLAGKPNGYVTALKDSRDNEVYAVAKLADGNYWMIENLRLDNTAELTTENTNNPFTIDNSVAIKNNDGSDYNHLSPSSNDLCNYNNSDISQMAWCVNQSYLNTNNTVNSYLKGDPYKNTYSYGNYYNWYSATAGNGTYEKSSGNVSGDVCPAGWRLPISGKIGGNKSFSYLDIAMGGTGKNQSNAPEASNRWRSFPTNFILAGELVSSDITTRNSFGIYWSSTAEYNNATATWFLGESIVAPGNRYKSDRISVRCIMQ